MEPRDILLRSVAEGAKRQPSKAACFLCRQRKQKCDGKRPCDRCERRGSDCRYETQPDETPKQAVKRKYEELAEVHNEQSQFIQELSITDEETAVEMLNRLRSGESLRSIADQTRKGRLQDASQDVPKDPHHTRLQRTALLALCQSNASVKELLGMAANILSCISGLDIWDELSVLLQDKIVKIDLIAQTFADTGHDQKSMTAQEKFAMGIPDGSHDGPLYWVPAKPWTRLTNSDEAVSHLVSLFLSYCNNYWRTVEEDLFLRAMRSGDPTSEYCSPFLVNAILAWAANFSEINEAYSEAGDLTSRGQHFHGEALRLWRIEERRTSLTNIQALLVITLDSGMRGESRLCQHLIKSASHPFQVGKLLPSPSLEPRAASNFARAKQMAAIATLCLEISSSSGMMRESRTICPPADAMPPLDHLPDTTTYWSGFPYIMEPIQFRRNLLLQERRTLTTFTSRVLNLVAPRAIEACHGEDILQQIRPVGEEIIRWYQGLHSSLVYSQDMPAPLFEFHAQYLNLSMTLYDQGYNAAFGRSSSDEDEDAEMHDSDDELSRPKLRDAKWPFVFKAAILVRDFRKKYGLKISLPSLVQVSCEACFICLRQLPIVRHAQPNQPIPAGTTHDNTSTDPLSDTLTECVRLLVGNGAHTMLPCGVLRMIVHTAHQLQVELPEAVENMLRLIASNSSSMSDLEPLKSSYPDHALKRVTDPENERMDVRHQLGRKTVRQQALSAKA